MFEKRVTFSNSPYEPGDEVTISCLVKGFKIYRPGIYVVESVSQQGFIRLVDIKDDYSSLALVLHRSKGDIRRDKIAPLL